MNERIKLLALQADFQLDELPDNILIPLENFAESIVRECSLTAGLMEYEGRKNIGSQILDNFGIEE